MFTSLHSSGPSPGGAVTLGLTLLCGWRPQGLGALSRRLPRVAGAVHGALLLAKATLHGTLAPLAGHPACGRASAQVAAHGGGWLGCGRAVGSGQGGPVICALAEDHAVAEAWPAARGALRPVQGRPLGRAGWAVAGLQHRRAWLWASAVIQRLLLRLRHTALAHNGAAAHACVTAAAAAGPVSYNPVGRAGLCVAGALPLGQFAVGTAVVGGHG